MYFIEITILLSATYFIRKFFVKNLINEWASDSFKNKSWINIIKTINTKRYNAF